MTRITNKSILDLIPKSFRDQCRLDSDQFAQYHTFRSKSYVYVVYLTRVQGHCDKCWRIVAGEYLRYFKNIYKTSMKSEDVDNMVAQYIAEYVEPTVITTPLQ